jgi:hypothetical protein
MILPSVVTTSTVYSTRTRFANRRDACRFCGRTLLGFSSSTWAAQDAVSKCLKATPARITPYRRGFQTQTAGRHSRNDYYLRARRSIRHSSRSSWLLRVYPKPLVSGFGHSQLAVWQTQTFAKRRQSTSRTDSRLSERRRSNWIRCIVAESVRW